MSTLIVRPKDYEPSVVKLDKMRLTIGRSSRNDVCIGDPFASRLHAELLNEGDRVLLVDRGSANGTFLNGQRVAGTVPLHGGDVIRIGETELEFTHGDQMMSGATVYLSGPDAANLPADTITAAIPSRSTSDLISSIQSGTISGEMRMPGPARPAKVAES